jgi:hypothetical protein
VDDALALFEQTEICSRSLTAGAAAVSSMFFAI